MKTLVVMLEFHDGDAEELDGSDVNIGVLLRDALSDFRAARCPVVEYVARRYAGQSEKFRADKAAEVFRRLAVSDLLSRASVRIEDHSPEPARLDPEGTAEPRTRLLGHSRSGECVGPGSVPGDTLEVVATGERVKLT